MKVRTRFAPSPTGYLHVGGARTALYSWLFARHHQGDFILRIEDTDRERSTQASIDAILDGMAWLGLEYDEGPYYQTQHFDRYKAVIQQLLQQNDAYICTCSKERLEALREEQMSKKLKPRYDGHCRNKAQSISDRPYVIRFKNPLEGVVTFDDQIRGRVSVKNIELDDLIIQRSDGTPTYNLTVVVDDWDMKITHVIRGDDHINNTPRQINILSALGAECPLYAHVPMILGEDGKRLSKRHGAVSVMQYREEGYLPEALLNYLVRLGWSHGDQEIFSREEMTALFETQSINNSPAAFNTDKLLWLNQQYIKNLPVEQVASELAWHFEQAGIDTSVGPTMKQVVVALQERAQTLVEMRDKSLVFYQEFEDFEPTSAKKHLRPAILDPIKALYEQLNQCDSWTASALHECVLGVSESFELNMGKVAQPLRVAVTGSGVSPPIDVTLELIGKARVLARLARAIAFIEARASAA